ncbi:MAG: REP-associated tyrosine transposase [Acutalibacteraceae bacterium]
MPRQARKKSKTGIYHIMLRGTNGQQIFADSEDCEKFLEIIKDCKAISEFEIFAYCLMGNHIHLLLKENKEPIELIMKRIASRFVYWYNIKYQRVGHLFQDRFKSEPVENDEYFLTVIRYIHQNPVKAGICKKPQDYYYSSYNEFFKNQIFVDCNFVFGIIGRDEFIKFNNEKALEKCLDIEEKPTIRVTDEQAKKIIMKYSKCKSISEFEVLPIALKENYIIYFHENGLSIRQISRLCGETKGFVEKCLK